VLAEVEAAAQAADAATGEARARALDQLLAPDDVKVARREMDDTSFLRDRLIEAAKRLGKRVDELKALEADRRAGDEHERVLIARDRLAEEMERMEEPIMQIAHLVSQIEAGDREIGRLNATSTSRLGYIRPVLSDAAPAITALLGDAVVRDSFIAVAGLESPPVVSRGAGAKDKLRVNRSASSAAVS
jgi:hypothetical protein